jgi:hypothetical protein
MIAKLFIDLVRNQLTAEIEEIVPIEGSLVKLVDLHEDVPVNVFADRSLAAGLVSDQRLQHSSDLIIETKNINYIFKHRLVKEI